MLDPLPQQDVAPYPARPPVGTRRVPQARQPSLMVVVDTEEEFDWSKSFSRSAKKVDHVRNLAAAQAIFERYQLRPTYVVDYPVASQEAGYGLLREWLADGRCQIGAHLHPWVNPPFTEAVTTRNSYPGNLPPALEKEKLARLTEVIAANFDCQPKVYRAGRYGVGPATGAILAELGYEIDTSVVPFTEFRQDGGPDFTRFDSEPFWFGPSRRVLEIPLTVAWYGGLAPLGRMLQPHLMSKLGLQLHLPGILARLRLLERIRLTPEGTTFAELKRLADVMLRSGRRLFVLSFHSPSVVPGNTPYVRTVAERERFLGVIARFCEYFFGACGGVPTTPEAVRASLSAGNRESGDDGN